MSRDIYSAFAFDDKVDLGRGLSYWFFCPADTPFGHPRTPMFDSVFMNASNWAFSYAGEKISMPTSKGIALRSYHGYQLITVILPKSDEEVRMRAGRFKKAIGHLLENYDQLWAEAKDKLIGYTEKPKKFDFDKASWFEMAQLFRERIDAEREMYEINYYFGEGLGPIYDQFVDLCNKMLGINESDPLFQKLLSGFDNDSYDVDRGLYSLSVRADELGLRDILLGSKPEEAISKMESSDAGRQWVKEFRGFLDTHGWRCPLENEYITPTWVEEPGLPIRHIQGYLEKGKAFKLDEIRAGQAIERAKAEEELVSKLPIEQRDRFKELMKAAQKYYVWNVEHVYYCEMYQHAITRYVLLGIGKRMAKAGCIEKSEDTLFLIPEEIYKALFDPEACSLKATARSRREAWEENAKIIPPPIIGEVSHEEATMLILKSEDPIATKLIMGRMVSVTSEQKADLVGNSPSPGFAEGPARVIFSSKQLKELQEGDILVCPALSSSWYPVMSRIKGIVADRGASLSEPVFAAREYGIPVITNVIDGTSRVKTGQYLRVDGNLGTVEIMDLLYGKRVLIVDDEPDILETLEELLSICDVVKTSTFEEAAKLLKTEDFDVAILDIMGVDGYELLRIAREQKVIAVMLTAHALSLEDTVKSYRKGAASYVPKDELYNIEIFLNDVLQAKEKGKRFWWRWFDRLGPYYEKRFGPNWQNKYPEFWEMAKNVP